jgi:hypothetical protein
MANPRLRIVIDRQHSAAQIAPDDFDSQIINACDVCPTIPLTFNIHKSTRAGGEEHLIALSAFMHVKLQIRRNTTDKMARSPLQEPG